MPKVAKGKRQRAYRPKTRSGCPTCKVRRVKCDEARPSCLRCTSTGRKCDGYNNGHAWDSASALQTPHSSSSYDIVANPFFEIHTSQRSKRSFTFFLQKTCPQLSGFFGSDFWERLVLQAAYHESAIRHAIIAIGSVHELRDRSPAILDADNAFALENYSLAIRDLLVPLSRNEGHSVDVCLITSILFTCFENIQGRHASGGTHLRSGAKLLRETLHGLQNGNPQTKLLSKSHTDFYAPIDVLTRVFVLLDEQIAAMIGGDDFNPHESPVSKLTFNDVPLFFSSVEEAKRIYEYGLCLFTKSKAAQQTCDPVRFPAVVEAHTVYFETLISRFSIALEEFKITSGPSLTPKEDTAIAVLQLHVLDAYITFHVKQLPLNSQNVPCWDDFLPQIKEMLILGEKIISSDSSGSTCTTTFCLDMGIVPPLYNLATLCKDSVIRRKAIALLRSTSRQEGIWNSLMSAEAAERLLVLEENGSEQLYACTKGF